MPYKVWVVVFKDGRSRIGVKGLGSNWRERYRDTIADTEQIYGTQIPYRAVAKTPDGYRIMTPTEAKKRGYPYRRV